MDLGESRDTLQLRLGPCKDDLLSHMDSDSKGELNEEGDAEVDNDAALLDFAATSQKPHDISAATEKEKEAARRRSRHYLQNSKGTKE